jgi:hypothetical protein
MNERVSGDLALAASALYSLMIRTICWRKWSGVGVRAVLDPARTPGSLPSTSGMGRPTGWSGCSAGPSGTPMRWRDRVRLQVNGRGRDDYIVVMKLRSSLKGRRLRPEGICGRCSHTVNREPTPSLSAASDRARRGARSCWAACEPCLRGRLAVKALMSRNMLLGIHTVRRTLFVPSRGEAHRLITSEQAGRQQRRRG